MWNQRITLNNEESQVEIKTKKTTAIKINSIEDIELVLQKDIPHLRAFSLKLCKQKIEDANDLYQDTIYRILVNKDKFQPWTYFRAWSSTIMKNLFINTFRKKSKWRIEYWDYNESALKKVSREEDAESILAAEQIATYIASLKEDIRIPFLMHYEWFKYQEIADDLDLPLWTVKSRIFFARKALKKKIWPDYFDEDEN